MVYFFPLFIFLLSTRSATAHCQQYRFKFYDAFVLFRAYKVIHATKLF